MTAGVIAAAAMLVSAPLSVDFGRDVRPILANRCFKCHGPDDQARQARLRLDTFEGATDAAITPGDAAGSSLLERVSSVDPDVRMPPPEVGPALTADEVAQLTAWIDAGATYEPHWSFVPVTRPIPPGDASRHPIDAFVGVRLERSGLDPSPEADRAILARRVSLDLIGLPPSLDAVQAYVEDDNPDALERYVDRVLLSPHFGERWAQVWLDLARYADTKGYEADRRRTIWPYRDWVIDALNADMPFDQFTIEQLAGDLLPEPTRDQRIATAFHRNTMTNDEGGTDDEEFRVAAVIDRVNTTFQTWMGLTAGCAQCHTHKYDPITHEEYYRLFAYFNQTADVDAMDERPLLVVLDEAAEDDLAAARLARESVDAQYRRTLARLHYVDLDDAADLPEPVEEEIIWIDDALPAGATPQTTGAHPWPWIETAEAPPFAGAKAIRQSANGDHTVQSFFDDAAETLAVPGGGTLFVHVLLDPDDPPQQIMVQWHDPETKWEHRVYWGDDVIPWGVDGTASRHRAGDLPAAGAWVRLAVDAGTVGLAGRMIDGIALSQHGGTVTWDAAGLTAVQPPDNRHLASQMVWETRIRRGHGVTAPKDIRALIDVDPAARTAEQNAQVREYYLGHVCRSTVALLRPMQVRRAGLDERIRAIEATSVSMPVTVALPEAEMRTTHLLEGGSFLSPGRVVEPGVPAVFAPVTGDESSTRLGLARWLVDDRNPLTARVQVNRVWEQLFGIGLVETGEDFGIQGDRPSHPALLDWLAAEYMQQGWRLKPILRTIMSSATYRQSSAVRPGDLQRDPLNRLLARGPRVRLSAEVIRDQALAISGLLDRTLLGPPVFPLQPEGLWQVVYSNDRWATSADGARHRRAIYTFWRRTMPYPSMVTFDAPSREFCVSRRIRTNTPLQALVTLNDPAFIEAARAMAKRVIADGGLTMRERAAYGLRLAIVRAPDEEEVDVIVGLVRDSLAQYRQDGTAAALLAGANAGSDAAVAEHAAWTLVCNVILNLDEVVTKP